MDNKMFCYQCEQTAGCAGCTGAIGVCGKTADVAQLQDELTGALIGLAHAVENAGYLPKQASRAIIEGLFTTLTNVSFDEKAITRQIELTHAAKDAISPMCASCASPCGKTNDYDLNRIWGANEDIRSLKSLILFGLKGMAAYAYHALMLGFSDEEVNMFFCEALCKVDTEDTMETLLPTVMKVGEINLKCMALLDQANTQTYGKPQPTTVSLHVEKGPFIVVTGHDLKDLQLLLEQTAGKGINIYTHGEMLPAHAYPKLKEYPHLKGNFGTAWQNQQKEFDNLPAPILFTTNCLMPPKASYADRVYTTEVVAFPGATHIGEEKDFTPVIEKALELGGYPEGRLRGFFRGRLVKIENGEKPHGKKAGPIRAFGAGQREQGDHGEHARQQEKQVGGRGKEPEAALRLKAECRQAGDRNGAEGQQEGTSLPVRFSLPCAGIKAVAPVQEQGADGQDDDGENMGGAAVFVKPAHQQDGIGSQSGSSGSCPPGCGHDG